MRAVSRGARSVPFQPLDPSGGGATATTARLQPQALQKPDGAPGISRATRNDPRVAAGAATCHVSVSHGPQEKRPVGRPGGEGPSGCTGIGGGGWDGWGEGGRGDAGTGGGANGGGVGGDGDVGKEGGGAAGGDGVGAGWRGGGRRGDGGGGDGGMGEGWDGLGGEGGGGVGAGLGAGRGGTAG